MYRLAFAVAASLLSASLLSGAFASELSLERLVVPVAEKGAVGATGPGVLRPGVVRPGVVEPGVVGPGTVNPTEPGVVEASTSLKCGKTIYQITTGIFADGGKCTGTGSSRTCTDSKGNTASASCKGGCGNTSGGGVCTISLK